MPQNEPPPCPDVMGRHDPVYTVREGTARVIPDDTQPLHHRYPTYAELHPRNPTLAERQVVALERIATALEALRPGMAATRWELP